MAAHGGFIKRVWERFFGILFLAQNLHPEKYKLFEYFLRFLGAPRARRARKSIVLGLFWGLFSSVYGACNVGGCLASFLLCFLMFF